MDDIKTVLFQNHIDRIENILKRTQPEELKKAHKLKLKSACGIVIKGNKILLGLSNASDDRNGKWCFAGGGIDGDDEDCISAAIRETYEEMGITTVAYLPTILIHTSKPFLGFCVLTCDELSEKIEMNEEFDEAGWFDINALPEDIHPINADLLKMVNVKEI